MARFVAWAVHTEGSTRPAALIRIALAALLWAQWANTLQPFRDPSLRGVAIGLGFFASTTLMFVGLWTRAATAAAAAVALTLYYYVGVYLGRDAFMHHNTYLLTFATVLCALTPCGRSYSLDRWRALSAAARARRPPPPERGNLWGMRLMACQVSLMYLWSAYDKSNLGFLGGERIEYIVMWHYTGSARPDLPGFPALAMLAGTGVVLLEYTLAVGLLVPAVRRWLLLPGILLHAAFYLTVPVATFSLTVCCLYLAYLDADTVHRVIDELGGAAPPPPGGRRL